MALLQLQLGGVLDGDDAFALGDVARQDVQQRGLARTGAARDQDVDLGFDKAFQQLSHVGGQSLLFNQVGHAQRHYGKAPDGQHRPVNRYGRHHRVHARTIGQARIGHRAGLVNTPADPRNNLVDHLHQVVVVVEARGRQLQPALALDIHMVKAVDQNLADARVGHQGLQRPEAEHFVLQINHQLAVLLLIDRQLFFSNQLVDHAAHLCAHLLVWQLLRCLQVHVRQQGLVQMHLGGEIVLRQFPYGRAWRGERRGGGRRSGCGRRRRAWRLRWAGRIRRWCRGGARLGLGLEGLALAPGGYLIPKRCHMDFPGVD